MNKNIKTWQERYALLETQLATPANEVRAERRKSACRDQEIADLRAELESLPAAPETLPLNESDRLRLDWCARTLRVIADGGRAKLGDAYPEIVSVIGAIKVVMEPSLYEPHSTPAAPVVAGDTLVQHYIGGRMVRHINAPAGMAVTFGPEENTVNVTTRPAAPVVAEGLIAKLEEMRDAGYTADWLHIIATVSNHLAAHPVAGSPAEAWKGLVDKAIAVLNRHIVPDGISDRAALGELYGIFDGPEYRAVADIAQDRCDARQQQEMAIDRSTANMIKIGKSVATEPMPASEAPYHTTIGEDGEYELRRANGEVVGVINLYIDAKRIMAALAAPVPASEAASWRDHLKEWSHQMQEGFRKRWMHPVNHSDYQLTVHNAKLEGYRAGWRDCAKASLAAPAAPTDAKPDELHNFIVQNRDSTMSMFEYRTTVKAMLSKLQAAQSVRDAALREAADICGAIYQDHRDQYKGRGKWATQDNPRRADTHADGASDGASECEDAIRALIQSPQAGKEGA